MTMDFVRALVIEFIWYSGIVPDVNGCLRSLTHRSGGGWGGIRTHEGREPLAVFKTAAFNRSATHPEGAS